MSDWHQPTVIAARDRIAKAVDASHHIEWFHARNHFLKALDDMLAEPRGNERPGYVSVMAKGGKTLETFPISQIEECLTFIKEKSNV